MCADAKEAGADGFIAKPIHSLAAFQDTILANLPPERQPSGLRSVSDETVTPDIMAFHDDMAHIADVLSDAQDDSVLDYAAQFLGGVARSAKDSKLEAAADALASARAAGGSTKTERASLSGLVQQRLNHKLAI